MKVVRTIVWIIPMIGVGLAAVILVSGMASATGAPQEAVVAALACAVAILPYCFTRSVSEILDTWTTPESDLRFPEYRTDSEITQVRARPVSILQSADESAIKNYNPWKPATIAAGLLLLGGILVAYFATR
jgi:hypothetical protein